MTDTCASCQFFQSDECHRSAPAIGINLQTDAYTWAIASTLIGAVGPPTHGQMMFDSLTMASVTQIQFSAVSADDGAPNVASVLTAVPLTGILTLTDTTSGASAVFKLTGPGVDTAFPDTAAETEYVSFAALSLTLSSGVFSSGDNITASFSRPRLWTPVTSAQWCGGFNQTAYDESQVCGNCLFYRNGLCCFTSPNSKTQQGTGQAAPWPPVAGTAWCGDWSPFYPQPSAPSSGLVWQFDASNDMTTSPAPGFVRFNTYTIGGTNMISFNTAAATVGGPDLGDLLLTFLPNAVMTLSNLTNQTGFIVYQLNGYPDFEGIYPNARIVFPVKALEAEFSDLPIVAKDFLAITLQATPPLILSGYFTTAGSGTSMNVADTRFTYPNDGSTYLYLTPANAAAALLQHCYADATSGSNGFDFKTTSTMTGAENFNYLYVTGTTFP